MEYQYPYKDLAERTAKITEAENLGYRMLHDNFDPDWKRGDEPYGVMIFTDEPSPVVPIEPVRDLAAEIDDLKAGVEELKRAGSLVRR